MAPIVQVTSLTAPGLEPYIGLARGREPTAGQGLFVAESPTVIDHALAAGCQPQSFLMAQRHIQGKAKELLARCADVPVFTAPEEVLASLTGYQLTRGVLCAMTRPELPTLDTVCAAARRVAVLERIADPTNLGAIFRSAAALGMDAVLLTPTCCDPLYRRAVRVSMGAVFQVPWTYLCAGPVPWPQSGLEALHQRGFVTAALALTNASISIADPCLMAADRLALLLGSEGDGLAAQTIRLCTYTVRIPMSHGVDSLNVAAAAAVAFWQVGRHS